MASARHWPVCQLLMKPAWNTHVIAATTVLLLWMDDRTALQLTWLSGHLVFDIIA